MRTLLIVGGTGFIGYHILKEAKKRKYKITSISLNKPKFSLLTLFLLIEIDPIFFKYQPKIGINNSSFFKINTGELKIV